ncbi:MAG: hypothetical protein ACK50P_20080, partial [Planctomycetaceae bacterium]
MSDSDQITIESGVVITTSSSSGAAGSISLSSPIIVLQSGAQLLATGSTSAGDGTISLTANNVQKSGTATPLLQMIRDYPTNSSIQIGSNVTIIGGSVDIQSSAGDSVAEQNAISNSHIPSATINIPNNDFNTAFGALPFSVLIKQPTASITIGSGSSITSSGSVRVESDSTPYADSVAVFGSALTALIGAAWREKWIQNQSGGISAAFSYTDASATVELESNASITAASGSVTLETSTTNTTTALAQTAKNLTRNLDNIDPNTWLLSMGVAMLGTNSIAQVDAGATITAGQTVMIKASADDTSGAKAEAFSFRDGWVGASASYSQVDANVQAIVNGSITAGSQAVLSTLTFNPNFAIDFTTDSLTLSDVKDYTTGTPIRYEAGADGSSVPGLVAGQVYYVIWQSSTSLQLASSYANALSGTAISFGAGFPTLSGPNGTLPISVVSGTGTGEIFYDFGSWANGTTPLFTTGQSVTYTPLAGQFIGTSDGQGNYVGPLQAGTYTVNVVNADVTADNPFALQLLDASGHAIPLTTNPLLTTTTGTVYQVYTFQPASNSLNLNFPTQGSGEGQVSYPTPDQSAIISQLTNGTPLVYTQALGLQASGLVDGQTYYAVVDPANPGVIQLAATYDQAMAANPSLQNPPVLAGTGNLPVASNQLLIASVDDSLTGGSSTLASSLVQGLYNTATAGTFVLTLNQAGGSVTTASLDWDASADDIVSAIQTALGSAVAVTVTGSGTLNSPWIITPPSDATQALIAGVTDSLIGGSSVLT